MNTEKLTAADRRNVGIQALVNIYLPASNDYQLTFPHSGGWGSNIVGIEDNIRKLAALGRTQRWQDAVTRWQGMVGEQTLPDGLRWAILQGSVYASHAAQ